LLKQKTQLIYKLGFLFDLT